MRTSHPEWIPFWVAAVVFLACTAAAAQANKSTIQAGTRVETHSDANNPDDYAYNIVSVTRHLQGKTMGNVYYVYKHNLDRNSAGGHIAGVNVMRVFDPKTFASLGYSYNVFEESTALAQRSDRDRLRFGLYRTVYQRPGSARIMGFTIYNTQTDWSESRTLDLGFMYDQPITPHWSMNSMIKYSQAYGLIDTHVYNQYKMSFTFKMDDSTDLDIGYLFVDKTYSTAAGTTDDDHVFRAGIMYRYR